MIYLPIFKFLFNISELITKGRDKARIDFHNIDLIVSWALAYLDHSLCRIFQPINVNTRTIESQNHIKIVEMFSLT